MAWITRNYKLISVCPMICHNGQTADPLNQFSKALKQISSKRVKVESDLEEMARIEFLAGLYVGKNGPIVPSANIDSMIINAAKKNKEGVQAKSGVFCSEHMSIEYDGPRSLDDLWKDSRFRHSAIVRVGTARVVRTRPIFNEWSGLVKLSIEDSVVNPSRVDDWMIKAGSIVGLGDWRPQHGRFDVVVLK